MVDVVFYNSHIRLENVNVTICKDGRLYIDRPYETGPHYFMFNTSEISKDELLSMYKEVTNEWNEGEEDEEDYC